MPVNKKYKAQFHPSISYHVYNRTNGKENLFKRDEDKLIFLQMVKIYLFPYFEVHCYCLLSNHFHLLVTTKTFCHIMEGIRNIPKERLTKSEEQFLTMPIEEKIINFHSVYSIQFKRLFLAYCNYFNRTYNRKGNLFNRGFKRIWVNNELYFQKLVLYIHQNPVKHLLTKYFKEYQWSSYQEYIGEKAYINESSKSIEIFNTLEDFIIAHQKSTEYKLIANLLLE